MMRQVMTCIVVCFAAVGIARGQYSITVDVLSAGDDGFDGLPQDVLCVDVFADFPQMSDHWIWGGLRGLALNGARLRYAADPNEPALPVLFNPGTDRRFTTCFSRPRPRNASTRFTNAGAYATGALDPPGPNLIASSAEINIGYLASPPEHHPSVPGYVARIALEVSDVIGAPQDVAEWHAGLLEFAPADAVFVFRSEPSQGGSALAGTVNVTFDHPKEYGIDWGVWFVPEPTAAALFLTGAALALSRRRTSG